MHIADQNSATTEIWRSDRGDRNGPSGWEARDGEVHTLLTGGHHGGPDPRTGK